MGYDEGPMARVPCITVLAKQMIVGLLYINIGLIAVNVKCQDNRSYSVLPWFGCRTLEETLPVSRSLLRLQSLDRRLSTRITRTGTH